ncbi:TPA: hypothetical protein QCX40_005746 [Bacillus cereus]|nr:hypothetical protein [Bacillus cereus]
MNEKELNFESEILLIFNNKIEWEVASESRSFGGIDFKFDYQYTRPSVYLDTDNYDLAKLGSSLLLRPTNETRVGAIFKLWNSSLVGSKIAIRSEHSSLVDLSNLNSSSFITYYMNYLNIDTKNLVTPKLVVTQKRNHLSSCNLSNKKIHLSFDEVNFCNFKKEIIKTIYTLEIEETEKLNLNIKGAFLNRVADYFTDKYNVEKLSYSSKYAKGLEIIGGIKGG